MQLVYRELASLWAVSWQVSELFALLCTELKKKN